jgi:hypothetical protein
MARDNNQPFDRGTSFYGPDGVIDLANLSGVQMEGIEKEFEDFDFGAVAGGAKPNRSGLFVIVRVVRNMTGGNIFPSLQYKLNPLGTQLTGVAIDTSEPSVVADEFLPPAGVRNGDLCYVIVEGPTVVKSPSAGNFPTSITAKARVAATVGGRTTLLASTTANDVDYSTGRSQVPLVNTAVDTNYAIIVRRSL